MQRFAAQFRSLSLLCALAACGLFAPRAHAEALNELPEAFADRMRFPEETQAIVSSTWRIELPEPEADPASGALLGLTPMPERQVVFNRTSASRGVVVDTLDRHFPEPVTLRLSKHRYPFEDRHLDAMVWLSPPDADPETETVPEGKAEVLLKDADGAVLARHEIHALARSGLFFSLGFPPALAGRKGTVEVIWHAGETERGRTHEEFQVLPASGVATAGRIPLRVLNHPGATLSRAPMTTGVPFPRGALHDASQVRLVDENGQELPLQTRVTARWSRFGSIKWLLCDFTADLDGESREVFLEYGSRESGVGSRESPAVDGRRWASMSVDSTHAAFPRIDAGRLRVGPDGVGFNAAGDGGFTRVLDGAALTGAFVAHEDGRHFRPDPATPFVIEEAGSEKIVIRRAGWYVAQAPQLAVGSEPLAVGAQPGAGSIVESDAAHATRHPPPDSRFCQYVTRYVIHRDSPAIRIFHTWIFTGDGNHDRIANMGWRFAAAAALTPDAFPTTFGSTARVAADRLVQFDYQQYAAHGGASPGRIDGRLPGVMGGVIGDTRVLFGVKDFWQNFPSELAVDSDALTFYNWPKHNPPATFARPVQTREAFRHRFVHEGEVLDFRLPREYTEGDLWREACSREGHWAEGRPETANAQGIARTEEMFLYFADAAVGPDAPVAMLQGFNDESLRAVVDPGWMTASGAFNDGEVAIHPYDPERFPEEERLYALSMEAPAHWVERLGVYGMWLYGDYPTWNLNLPGQWVSAYRTFRKNHHAYPLRLTPFIRSGEPRFLKLGENAARQMADANFCHFATEAVDHSVGPDHFRRQGWWDRSLLPWAGRRGPHLRSYTIDTDYLWETYYVTGYARVRDVALLFCTLTQQSHETTSGTRSANQWLKAYLDAYQATFDPWFLNAAHEVARLHQHIFAVDDDLDPLMFDHPREVVGFDHWRAADQAFYAFTGCPRHEVIARNSAMGYANPRMVVVRAGTDTSGGANARLTAHAYQRTGDAFYLGRLAAALDQLRLTGYEGEIVYLRGGRPGGHGGGPTGVGRGIPMAMSLLAGLETRPAPIHDLIWLDWGHRQFEDARIYVKQTTTAPLNVNVYLRGGGARSEKTFRYGIDGPDGFRLEGEGDVPSRIPLAVDPGVYRVEVEGDQGGFRLYLPLTRPEVPEVLGFPHSPDGTDVPAPTLGYWFQVPEGVESFWIDFRVQGAGRGHINRISVWDPDNRQVWDHHYTGDPPGRIEIDVPAGMDGRIWRATGGNFRIDPIIPPFFALGASRWFDPR